jgi:hypothetical protein
VRPVTCLGMVGQKCIQILFRKFESNRSLKSMRPKWDGIEMDHTEIGYEVLDCICLGQY